MKRLSILLVPVLFAVAACGGASTDRASTDRAREAPELPTVTVANAPSTLFAPLYVAQAKGYFTDEGVKVNLQMVKSGQDAVPLAASGKVDVVVAGFSAGLFNALHAGLGLKVVGSMGGSTGDPEASPTALEVSSKLASSGKVTSPADLRGRKIAVAGGLGGAGAYYLAILLWRGGLSLTDVTVVNLAGADIQAALANGSVAAAMAPAPLSTRMEKDGVATVLGVPPAGAVASGVIYGAKFAGTPAAQPFFTALVRASRDLQGEQAKSPENVKFLAEALGQDLELLRAVPPYRWRPDLAPVSDQLDAQQRIYQDAGLLDYRELIPAAKYVQSTFSAAAVAARKPPR